jgi:hypothetical protein
MVYIYQKALFYYPPLSQDKVHLFPKPFSRNIINFYLLLLNAFQKQTKKMWFRLHNIFEPPHLIIHIYKLSSAHALLQLYIIVVVCSDVHMCATACTMFKFRSMGYTKSSRYYGEAKHTLCGPNCLLWESTLLV